MGDRDPAESAGLQTPTRRELWGKSGARHNIQLSTTNDRVATRVDENWGWPPAGLDNSGIRQVTLSNFQRSVNHCRRHLTMRTTCFGTGLEFYSRGNHE